MTHADRRPCQLQAHAIAKSDSPTSNQRWKHHARRWTDYSKRPRAQP